MTDDTNSQTGNESGDDTGNEVKLSAAPSPGNTAAPEEHAETGESFADVLRDFERTHTHRAAAKQLEGTVVSLTPEQVILDIGYKMEGVLPRAAFENNAEGVKRGDVFPVSIRGRNQEGYYELSRFRVAQPRDWTALERAFAEKTPVAGTVTAAVKGGLSVDVGVRAFMPASRSGTRDAAELEALVGAEITCRITKLDVADENVVVDRRVVLEEQARASLNERRAALKPGDTVTGTVRSLMPYGAFVDIGGVDGLLHVSDISRARIAKPEDVLSVGQELTLKVLKIDAETRKVSLGLKQTLADPWLEAQRRFPAGAQVEGPVTKLMNFGAFVEIAEGVEGLVHISEIVAGRRLNHPSEVLRAGQRVQALVLAVDAGKRQIKLSLKQLIPTGLDEYIAEHKPGDTVSGRVVVVTAAGADVELGDGIRARCKAAREPKADSGVAADPKGAAKPDPRAGRDSNLTSLSAMLAARWKGNAPAPQAKPEPAAEGQVRSFKIVKLDTEKKTIELELA